VGKGTIVVSRETRENPGRKKTDEIKKNKGRRCKSDREKKKEVPRAKEPRCGALEMKGDRGSLSTIGTLKRGGKGREKRRKK